MLEDLLEVVGGIHRGVFDEMLDVYEEFIERCLRSFQGRNEEFIGDVR